MIRFFSLLFLLCASAAFAADNNIVVVLDTSASMNDWMRGVRNQTKIDVAKSVLSDVLTDLPASTNIGVLSFNGWVYEFGEVDRNKLRQSIIKTHTYGGTPLWEYIKVGADKLLEVRKQNNNAGVYKLLVVTDGEANDASLATYGANGVGYLQDIKNRNIIIDAIGLDMPQGHSLQNQVNGTYMRGDDPTSLQHAVEQSVAEVAFQDSSKDSDFETIATLPEDFASGIVQAMSHYENHPIGQSAPVVQVAEDGTVTETTQTPAPPQPAAGGGCLAATFCICVAGCLGFVFLISRRK